ncbi:hypothetical protein V2A60_002950 [Cordyceps javanica]|uniref:Uncharacterized protein n=1 Tax=Cordyceps javanica TaxID=43265 RepID=A0A545V4P2_9HYPO|nr:hypothetical protein IF1G_05247 [Cordyceps javanica]
MKLSFMLTLCAGVAVTTPVGARQGLQKLPFFKPGNRNDPRLCGTNFDVWNERSSERCVGTIKYCENKNWRMFREKFDSVDECFQSRQPAPQPAPEPTKLPFKVNRTGIPLFCGPVDSAADFDKKYSEDCVGTIEYCKEENWWDFGEKFESEDECLKSRNPAPGAEARSLPATQ